MPFKNQKPTPHYIHISIPEILLGHINIDNTWQSFDQEWSYRIEPPYASHPFQRDVYVIKSKKIKEEEKLMSDNYLNKENKNLEAIESAKIIIKKILDLSKNLPIENWLNDTGHRSIIESMVDKNKVKILEIT
ncbi:hypothetical protein I6J48_01870 [Acinetobacter calcoaceticus]|uniref:DUF6367 family protein n=1 Tax=Acinetobacter calcoaceticus TaxID=471 RepID=UPI0019676285|nr:DUF6367 family protein [Acinetobacter calcoaceticus]QSB54454.1 hypothetical protein I6J48_01870 [Acinetobacter calcoaceticus]